MLQIKTDLLSKNLRNLSAQISGKISSSRSLHCAPLWILSASLWLNFQGTSLFAQRDSSTIIQYIDQCNETYYANPDSSFEFCLKAEKESKYQGNFTYAGEIALCKARYHILVTDYETANAELSFAINCFEQKKNYAKLSKAMSLKSILLDRIGEHYQSTKVLREAYLISKNHGDKAGEISRLI
ncbi:MAG: hypothetical protein JNJ99_13070, partial [Crocinitomicaceae bacterium]|nr:hypothetical protein [Crocinitomicaceae bacterium]